MQRTRINIDSRSKACEKLGYEKRYELNALAALEAKGISNPYIAYTLAKLNLMSIDLKLHLPSGEEALKEATRSLLGGARKR